MIGRALAALLALISAGCGTAERASAEEARTRISEGATVLDVRTPAEYAAGHVEAARNIPVDELPARLSEVPRGAPVVVYCQSGRRSARAAATLREAGYEVHDVGPMSALDER